MYIYTVKLILKQSLLKWFYSSGFAFCNFIYLGQHFHNLIVSLASHLYASTKLTMIYWYIGIFTINKDGLEFDHISFGLEARMATFLSAWQNYVLREPEGYNITIHGFPKLNLRITCELIDANISCTVRAATLRLTISRKIMVGESQNIRTIFFKLFINRGVKFN